MPIVEVAAHEQVGDQLFSLTFTAPIRLAEGGYQPGQFLHIRVSDSFDFLLRRPLSLCKVDLLRNHLTVVYRAQGVGTRRLSSVRVGESIDVLGPLGRGFPIHAEDRRVLLVGGGIGVPPLVELARQLNGKGKQAVAVVGFQTCAQALLIADLAEYGDVTVMSDDGSIGVRGLVTEALTAAFCQTFDRYYACGPTPMLRALQSVMRERRVPGYLSLEERMGCGIGLCVGCVHPVLRAGVVKNVKTCREGPVFAAEEVVFA